MFYSWRKHKQGRLRWVWCLFVTDKRGERRTWALRWNSFDVRAADQSVPSPVLQSWTHRVVTLLNVHHWRNKEEEFFIVRSWWWWSEAAHMQVSHFIIGSACLEPRWWRNQKQQYQVLSPIVGWKWRNKHQSERWGSAHMIIRVVLTFIHMPTSSHLLCFSCVWHQKRPFSHAGLITGPTFRGELLPYSIPPLCLNEGKLEKGKHPAI